MNKSKPIAFALSETWLNDSHLEAEAHIEGYVLYREDRKRKKYRKGRSSGGVGIYVREDFAISSEVVFSYGNGVIESIGVHIQSLNLVIIDTYRSPDNSHQTTGNTPFRSTHVEFCSYLAELKKFLSSLPSPTPDILLIGDYNMPHAVWSSGECTPGASTDEQRMVRSLYELCLEHFLVHQLDQPTHKDGNTIDLIFTNNTDLIYNIDVVPSSKSDHYRIELSVAYTTDKSHKKNDIQEDSHKAHGFYNLNFFSDDTQWESLEDELSSYSWNQEFRGLDTTEMMTRFNSVCLAIAQKWVPASKHSSKNRSKSQKIPRHRRALMRKRTRLNKKYVTARSESRRSAILNQLIDTEKELSKSHEDQRDLEEKKAIEKIKTNPKFFFTYGRKFSKVKTGVGPLLNAAKKLISAPLEMAELLSEQYSSVFSTPVYDNISEYSLFPDVSDTNQGIYDIVFSDAELADAMNELSPNAAPGPDGFPAILLKRCRNALSSPLAKIWRNSLKQGEIPEVCKSAFITPIHKGKSKAVPKNYRPVALTSHLIKVFEKVIRKKIVQFLQEHNLFNLSQHGFLQGRSCLSQLLCHFDRITHELENGRGVDVVYLDFAKAFDKVDHGITLHKFSSLGIKGSLGRWIHTFLTNRYQSVVIEGKISKPKPVISGVPQGSVLGPLLFLILIGDIDKDVASAFLSSFADDTRIGRGITSDADINLLQADLESIYRWSTENNMSFNSDKFELLRYKSKDSKQIQATSNYRSNQDSIIEENDHICDLGIQMSNDATFKKHIHDKCTSIKSKIAWVLRTFKARDSLTMLTLWKSQIQCHLDYCSQLWSPQKIGLIQTIELLQKAFFSRINGMYHLNYWDQLTHLKSYSLERRRERYQIIYTWRIIEGQVPNFDCTPIESHQNERRGRLCRIPVITSAAPCSIKTIRSSSLPFKGPRLFNILPKDTRNLSGCDTLRFKRELDRFLASVPDQPHIPGLTQYRRVESNSVIDWANSPYLLKQDTQHQRGKSPGAHRGGYDVMT